MLSHYLYDITTLSRAGLPMVRLTMSTGSYCGEIFCSECMVLQRIKNLQGHRDGCPLYGITFSARAYTYHSTSLPRAEWSKDLIDDANDPQKKKKGFRICPSTEIGKVNHVQAPLPNQQNDTEAENATTGDVAFVAEESAIAGRLDSDEACLTSEAQSTLFGTVEAPCQI